MPRRASALRLGGGGRSLGGVRAGAGKQGGGAGVVFSGSPRGGATQKNLPPPPGPPAMPAGPCAQFCFALSALLSPALCAAVDDPASRPPGERPFIGLLLPLNAPEFSRASEAVRLGCQAALAFAENRQSLQVARTDVQPASILRGYSATVQRGAAVIVGPLTRSGVTALAPAGRISVLTLALNVTDGDVPLPPRLYTFGLSAA